MNLKEGDKVYNFVDGSNYKYDICIIKAINNTEFVLKFTDGSIERHSIKHIKSLKRCYK